MLVISYKACYGKKNSAIKKNCFCNKDVIEKMQFLYRAHLMRIPNRLFTMVFLKIYELKIM